MAPRQGALAQQGAEVTRIQSSVDAEFSRKARHSGFGSRWAVARELNPTRG